METKKLSKSLTDNRFGGWGWSMIFYTMILYFFYAAITTDGMNLIPSAFAEAHGWDANTLLSVATPAGLIGLVGGFVFGRLVIKTKPKNMSAVTLIITGILYALLGMVPSVALYTIDLMLICFLHPDSVQQHVRLLSQTGFRVKKELHLDGRLWVHQSVPVRLLPDLLYCLQQKESVQHLLSLEYWQLS